MKKIRLIISVLAILLSITLIVAGLYKVISLHTNDWGTILVGAQDFRTDQGNSGRNRDASDHCPLC